MMAKSIYYPSYIKILCCNSCVMKQITIFLFPKRPKNNKKRCQLWRGCLFFKSRGAFFCSGFSRSTCSQGEKLLKNWRNSRNKQCLLLADVLLWVMPFLSKIIKMEQFCVKKRPPSSLGRRSKRAITKGLII
jgi:hypothetical protein